MRRTPRTFPSIPKNISSWATIARTLPTAACGVPCPKKILSAALTCVFCRSGRALSSPGACPISRPVQARQSRYDPFNFIQDHSESYRTMIRDTIPAEELLNKARAVGQYYGFVPLSTLTLAARGSARTKTVYPEAVAALALEDVAEIVAGFLKHCQKTSCAPTPRQPLFIWHPNIAPGRPAQKKAVIQFHAAGSDRAIADAVVIRALLALVRVLSHEEPTVRVNAMGDKEPRARFARELSNFFK